VKLVPKLALALLAGVFAVVAGFTAFQVRRDIQLFDEDVKRDQRLVGVTAAAAQWKNRVKEDAIRLAQRVDDSRESIHVRYVSFAEDAPAALRPMLALRAEELPAQGKPLQRVKPRRRGVDAADLLVTYVAAPVSDAPHGAMELSQSLAPRAEYVWRGVWSALASGLAMLVVGGAAMALIGARVVGRPVDELIAAAHRIGDGHFDLPQSERRDELGELARALHAMSRDLSAARSRAARETEARIQALEQLRHAERLSTLGQLASVLAHEIGTPLNVIAGHAKLIASGKLDASATRESGGAIGVQSERITSIVRRVLDYARRTAPKRARIDAVDVVQQTRAMLRSLAEGKSVELAFEPPAENVELFADPAQVQQALTNVLMNAVHASPTGATVELRLESSKRTSNGEVTHFIVFVVHDKGSGVDEHTQAKIFEPFFTTKPPGEGTGLGLSVARDIAVEHGGSIEVSSTRGAGTTFKIYLPRSGTDAPNSRS
jgi:signal transduction histidine kinase